MLQAHATVVAKKQGGEMQEQPSAVLKHCRDACMLADPLQNGTPKEFLQPIPASQCPSRALCWQRLTMSQGETVCIMAPVSTKKSGLEQRGNKLITGTHTYQIGHTILKFTSTKTSKIVAQ